MSASSWLPEPVSVFRPLPGLALYFTAADLAELNVDVLVSSDDTWLSMSGGVSASIAERAGQEAKPALETVSGTRRTRLQPGDVVESGPGKLSVQRIYHAAVVDWAQDIGATRETVYTAATK